MQVHSLIDKRTDNTALGGHGTQNGIYSTLKGLKSALKTSYFHWRDKSEHKHYEVVTYELVEVNRQSLEEFMQGSSKG